MWSPNDFDRFMAKVDTSGGPDACWPWTAAKGSGGYGNFRVNGKTWTASRWLMGYRCNRQLRSDEHALHRCDNPACCNLAHLYIGDHAQNMRDRDARNRDWQVNVAEAARRQKGVRYRPGELNPRAKLTMDQVREIRAEYIGKRGQINALAERYGVSPTHVGRIVKRRCWT